MCSLTEMERMNRLIGTPLDEGVEGTVKEPLNHGLGRRLGGVEADCKDSVVNEDCEQGPDKIPEISCFRDHY